MKDPLPPEFAKLVKEKVAEGLESARAGKLIDSDTAIARLQARLNKLEQERQRR